MNRYLTSFLSLLLFCGSTVLAHTHQNKNTPSPLVDQTTTKNQDTDDQDFVALTDDALKPYQLGKSPVTAAQYAAFLNAVAAPQDPHHFYQKGMEQQIIALPSPSSGVDCYIPLTEQAGLPVSFVSFYDAISYCNWMEHGAPTRDKVKQFTSETGQDITDSGAYNITYKDDEPIITQDPQGSYHLPSEDELSTALSDHQISAPVSEWTSRSHPTASQNSLTSLNPIGEGVIEAIEEEWAVTPSLYDATETSKVTLPNPSNMSSSTGFRIEIKESSQSSQVANGNSSGLEHSSIVTPPEDEIIPPDFTPIIDPAIDAKAARKRIIAARYHLAEEVGAIFALSPLLIGAWQCAFISTTTFAAISSLLLPVKIAALIPCVEIWWNTH